MAKPTPIGLVPKPTLLEQARTDVIDILEKALDRAKSGEIETILVIMKHLDGCWSDERSIAIDFPEAIGRLEIVQHAWMNQYLREPKE